MTANLAYLLTDLHPAADALLKATVLLLLGLGMHSCLSRRNPRWRVLMWRAGLAGIVLAPLLSALAPDLPVTVEPWSAASAILELEGGESAGPGIFEEAWNSPNQFAQVPNKAAETNASAPGPIAAAAPMREQSAFSGLLTPNLSIFAIVCWAMVSMVLAGLSLRSHRRVSRMIEESDEPAEDLLALLKQSAVELGLRRVPRLRLSAAVESPFLTGLRRPIILLPARFADRERSDDLAAVLAHELSHLASRDLGWFAAFNAMALLFWFHPLVWIARGRHTVACEELSDAMAAEKVGDTGNYSGTLARIALQLVKPMPSSAGIAMARTPQIVNRLNSLKRRLSSARLDQKQVLTFLAIGAVALSLIGSFRLVQASEERSESESTDDTIVYEVNKKVSDFPLNDFSTPESAAATIHRIGMTGGSNDEWRKLSIRDTSRRMPRGAERKEVSPEIVEMWNNGVIREVRIYLGQVARVFTEINREGKIEFDQRSVALEDGRWLNDGHDGSVESLEEAREIFDMKKARFIPIVKTKRPKVENPDEHLKTFVEFLQEEGKDPQAFVLEALAKHKVVLMGETHHRPRYWAFNSSLVEDPEFAERVGVIYMELPMNCQDLIDQFLAAEELDTAPAIEMLRDMLWMGWPDQPMLDFLVAVWKANQKLPAEKRIRAVLVDMQRPWDKIETKTDWSQYNCDRDKLMAENIVEDLQKNKDDKRNALFTVGCGHAHLRLTYGDKKTIAPSAGSYLCDELGDDQVFSIIQHAPVMENMGRVHGRVCLGLFDSAFAALNHKPSAFPLDTGPFGEEPCDRFPDESYIIGKYRDGYSAYLYLCPLEDEIFSPLIPGFYDEEFMKEIDRRFRLSYGKPWHEAYGSDATDVDNFVDWMSGRGGSWGNLRDWTGSLGPLDAWKLGDNWQQAVRVEKHKDALEHPDEILDAARKMFEAIQNAPYDRLTSGKEMQSYLGSAPNVRYTVYSWWDIWAQWVYEHFKENPIVSIELSDVAQGEIEQGRVGRSASPAVSYKLTLKDGSTLEGELPFYYDPQSDSWSGRQGLDWHLDDEPWLKKQGLWEKAPKRARKQLQAKERAAGSHR